MRRCSHARSLSSSRDGVALVIVLAFIVLLSILVVSFVTFSRLNRGATASYSRSIQAEEIAQGGMQDILSDLHQEIIAGSTVTSVGANTVYIPLSNTNAIPARLGYNLGYYGTDINGTSLPPTLVRVSRASQDANPGDFYPALSTTVYTGTLPMNYASLANSSSNSINGRYVSASRWNKIALLTTNNTAATYIPPPFSTNTPDWVYYTRAGRAVCTTASLSAAPSANIKPSSNLTNAAPVIGRYAYAVYDESALLDINTAGYISAAGNAAGYATNVAVPSVPATNNPAFIKQTLSAKSYLAYADLTQLPGLSGTQTSVIDPLIKWRNASVDLTTAATASTNYFQMVFNGAKSGFTSFQTSGNGTDSPILGRQDLINYFAKIDSSGTTYSQALPYLGTFSRAANAPSWAPMLNAQNLPGYYGLNSTPNGTSYNFVTTYTPPGGGTPFTVFNAIPYKDNANLTVDGTTDQGGNPMPNANRAVANVRYTTAQTITHYNDDGTSYTYNVQAGSPLVQHRFSLARLAWLTSSGVASGISAQAVQDCFGLTWDATNSRWSYVAATTSDVHILTLGEVAAGCTATANPAYREPNFFEMLKAGILSGSLGQSPGPNDTAATTMEGVVAGGLDSANSEKNRHILQIGANIIDQFDSDSLPTAIYLKVFGVVPPATSLTTEADLAFNTVYGDENLPDLTRLNLIYIEDWYDTVNSKGYFKTWIYPELWNIHQAPGTGVDATVAGSAGYPRPTQFRVHAYGKSSVLLSLDQTVTGFGTGVVPSIDYDTTTAYTYHQALDGTAQTVVPSQASASVAVNGSISASSPANLLYFTDLGSALSPFYRNPNFLQFQNLYTNTDSSSAGFPFVGTYPLNLSIYNPASPAHYNHYNLPQDMITAGTVWNGNAFAALFAGEYTLPDFGTKTPHILVYCTETNPLYYFLEFQDPATLKWHPYNFISQLCGDPNLTAKNRLVLDDQTSPVSGNYAGTPGGTTTADHASNGVTNQGNTGRGGSVVRPDPRTDRFSVSRSRSEVAGPEVDHTMAYSPLLTTPWGVEDYWPSRTWGFVYAPDQGSNPTSFGSGTGGRTYLASWAVNQNPSGATRNAFYVDPDGVLRPGDSYRQNLTTGDGAMLYHGTFTSVNPPVNGVNPPNAASSSALATTPTSLLPTTLTSTTSVPTGSAQARRPEILNRPFRSVAELGYAFRDLPFKTLDFSSKASADGALLDLFSITDEPGVTAGEVNPSNMPASSLAAIFTGANKMDLNNPAQTANFIAQADAQALAASFATQIASQGPLANRADLVKVLDPGITALAAVTATANYGNKAYAEGPVRALANVTNTRTWNLLIDIIAQSGNMSPKAATLNDFVVQGERRYWLHIAIDRYTGKIVDQQLEPVYE